MLADATPQHDTPIKRVASGPWKPTGATAQQARHTNRQSVSCLRLGRTWHKHDTDVYQYTGTQARYMINSTNDTPYCTCCNSQVFHGALFAGTPVQLLQTQTANRQQQNNTYAPRFQQPRCKTMQ